MFLFHALRDTILVLLAVSGVHVPTQHDWRQQFRRLSPLEVYVAVEAEKNAVDPALALAIVYQESRFRASAASPTRDFGLFQLHCGRSFSWCRRFGVTPRELLDPRLNVALGLEVVRTCQARALRCKQGGCPHLLHYFNRGDAYRRSVLRHAERYRDLLRPLFPRYESIS
jgi:hypothetical protein